MNNNIKELLEFADEDLKAAKILINEKLFRLSAFHSQQAVEKYLKVFLLYNLGAYPFIHSISDLLEECIKLNKDFEYLEKIKIKKLNKYYIFTRYFKISNVTEEDAKEAIDIAGKVREFILNKLNIQQPSI
ncbi:DNA-binding protein [Nanoarchaeota archaeon]